MPAINVGSGRTQDQITPENRILMEILAAFGNSPNIDPIRNISSVLGAEKIIIYNTANRQMYSVPFLSLELWFKMV